ncbi:hypothetical protein QBC40DRAFT_276755, partial [Triangularia verruculosa]
MFERAKCFFLVFVVGFFLFWGVGYGITKALILRAEYPWEERCKYLACGLICGVYVMDGWGLTWNGAMRDCSDAAVH